MKYELGREFCRRVTAQLRHVTSREKAAIEEELLGHIEDRMEALTALKWPEDEAEQRAVAAMGDPEEMGRRLAKEYPLSWLVVGRIALLLILILCIPVLAVVPSLIAAGENVVSRIWPEWNVSVSQMEVCDEYWQTDIRAEIGNDVLRIFRVGITRGTDGLKYVRMQMCAYDKHLFGEVNTKLTENIWAVSAIGEIRPAGGYSSGAGKLNWRMDSVPVEPDADELLLIYKAYGRYVEIRVPLTKEESA